MEREPRHDRVDLSREALEQARTEVSFKANLNFIRDESERTGEIIDIVA